MINDAEMLTYILQNAEMGCQGVKDVRDSKRGGALDAVLSSQMARYGKIYNTAGDMLRNRGEEIHHVSPMAKTMARFTANRDIKRDPSSSHIAEMMIKGNTMGVNKMAPLRPHRPEHHSAGKENARRGAAAYQRAESILIIIRNSECGIRN